MRLDGEADSTPQGLDEPLECAQSNVFVATFDSGDSRLTCAHDLGDFNL